MTDDIGHNSGAAAERLRSFVQRIERLEEEKKTIAGDIREVKAEAKSDGYDIKALNEVLRLRRMDAGDRTDLIAIVDTYAKALGMQLDLFEMTKEQNNTEEL